MRTSLMDRCLLIFAVVLAAFLWYIMFGVEPFNFWVEMTVSTLLLGGFALWRLRLGLGSIRLGTRQAWLLGMGSAALLYSLFWLGNRLSPWLLPASHRDISAVYGYRTQANPLVILLLLLFIIGPCEEIFWRGYVQSSISRIVGRLPGFILVSFLYGLVHIWSGNPMLVLAALACGFFWGWIYHKRGKLAPVIISHALWDVMIFVILPVR